MNMALFTVTAVFLLIFIIQGLPLIRQKKWGDFYVFLGIFLLAGYIAYGEVLGFYVPNPVYLIKWIFDPLARLMFQ